MFVITGHLTAACVTLQNKLGRSLLWLVCRKHVGEVLLSHVWEALKIETSKSPDIELSKRFSDSGFPATPHATATLHTRDPQELGDFGINKGNKLKVMIDSIREAQAYPRGDYKELLDLMEAYIGKNIGQFKFTQCGAHICFSKYFQSQLVFLPILQHSGIRIF